MGFPQWLSGKELACQRRRLRRGGFYPWVGKIPWRRKWQPTQVFFPGASHRHECVCAQSLSCVWLFATLWTIAHQAPLSFGFSRQEYGKSVSCHFLLNGIFPTQGSNSYLLYHLLHWQVDSFSLSHLEAKNGIKIARGNSYNLRYADDTIQMAESEEKLKNLLMRVKEESEKAGLKFSIKKWRSWGLVPPLHGK